MLAVMAEHTAAVTNNMDAFIYPFSLNVFSFAAGYVYLHRPGFGNLMKKKFKQLFIPWLIFSMFIILSSYVFSFSDNHTDLWRDIGLNFLQVHMNGDQMWYIAALFEAYIPFYFFVRAYESSELSDGKKKLVFLLMAFILAALGRAFAVFVPATALPWCVPAEESALPWHLEYIFQAMLFMLIGYIFRQSWEKHCGFLDKPLAAVLLLGLYVLSIYSPSIFHFSFSSFGAYAIFYPRSLFGVAAAVSVSRCIPATHFSDFVGQSTLAYYGLHGKCISVISVVIRRIFPNYWLSICFGTELEHVVGALVIVMITSVVLIIPTVIINRFFPFAVGKPRKQHT